MTAAIKTLLADESEKYLGMRGRLDGSPADHLVDMRKKIEEWMEAINAGTLPTRLVWKSYQYQLWAGMQYGLGALPASMKKLEEGLGATDFYLISKLGVVRSIAKEWRYFQSTFGGMGLYSLPIEATVCSINLFLQHYGSGSNLCLTIKASLQEL